MSSLHTILRRQHATEALHDLRGSRERRSAALGEFFMRTLAVILAFAVTRSEASAQCPPDMVKVDGGPFIEVWVDPYAGQDRLFFTPSKISAPAGLISGTTDVAGAQASPFKTINNAIGQVFVAVASLDVSQRPLHAGIVHLEPGIYTNDTQTFPIQMRPFVNVQGMGARHCVIRSDGTGEDMMVFLPKSIPGGTYCPMEVLVDYSISRSPEESEVFYSEMIDGVTFQGGDVQVYSEGSPSDGEEVFGRISNCVFDMLDYVTTQEAGGVGGPLFGVLIANIRDQVTTQFSTSDFDIFNNTFIQGWAAGGELGDVTAQNGSVAICSTSADVDTCTDLGPGDCLDCSSVLTAAGNHNIQNNLFRSLSGHVRESLLGLDSGSTAVVGSPQINTNWFRDGTAIAGQSSGFYRVDLPSGQLPQPAASYEDPGFVGEMLTSFPLGDGGATLLSRRVGRDWRILPTSPLIDMGVGPDASGAIVGVKRTYVEPSSQFNDCDYSPIDSFDFDGEGYGNRRIRSDGPVHEVDIGFDEFERMIHCGFGNESIAVLNTASPCDGVNDPPCYCFPVPGHNKHFILLPDPGPGTPPSVTFSWGMAVCTAPASSILPGMKLPPVVGPGVDPFVRWFEKPGLPYEGQTPVQVNRKTNYIPPDVPNHAYTFGATAGLFLTPNGRFMHSWAKYLNVWTNTQSTFLGDPP